MMWEDAWKLEWECWYGNGREWNLGTHSRSRITNRGVEAGGGGQLTPTPPPKNFSLSENVFVRKFCSKNTRFVTENRRFLWDWGSEPFEHPEFPLSENCHFLLPPPYSPSFLTHVAAANYWVMCRWAQTASDQRVRPGDGSERIRQSGRRQPGTSVSTWPRSDVHEAALLATDAVHQVRLHGRRHAGTSTCWLQGWKNHDF